MQCVVITHRGPIDALIRIRAARKLPSILKRKQMASRAVLILALLATGPTVLAQQAFDKKIIPGVRTVELAGPLPGYAFFAVRDVAAPDAPIFTATRMEFVPRVKQVVAGDLYVVPELALKGKTIDGEFGLALANSAIEGAHRVPPVHSEEVSIDDPRTESKVAIIIRSIDPNAGLIYDRTSNDPDDPQYVNDGSGKVRANGLPATEKPRTGGAWWLYVVGGLVIVALLGVAVIVVIRVLIRRKPSEDDEDDDD